MTLKEFARSRRNEIVQLGFRYGAREFRLFGSVARGDERPDSDFDFLVELDKNRSLLDLGGLLMDLQQLLGRKVDVVTEQSLRPRMRERVLREAVVL